MSKNTRLGVMLLACVGLGVLVWLDAGAPTLTAGRGDGVQPPAPVAADLSDLAEGPGGTADETDDPDDQALIGASEYKLVPDDDSQGNPLSAIEIGSLRDTVSRPLFASSRRRPPQSDDGTVAAAPAEPPTFELLGVALGGSRAIAVLRRKSDGRSYRVQAGDMLAGWQVTKVEPREVVLERDEGLLLNLPLLRQ